MIVGGFAEAATAISPFSLPAYAVAPPGAKRRDVGAFFNWIGFPASGGVPVIGTRKVVHWTLAAHEAFVLAAYTLNAAEVVLV